MIKENFVKRNFRAEYNKLDKQLDEAIKQVIKEKGDEDFIELDDNDRKILGGAGDEFWDSVAWDIDGVGVDEDDDIFLEGGPDWIRLSVIEKIQIYEAITK